MMQTKRDLTFFVIIVFISTLFIYLERKNTLKIEGITDCSNLDRILFKKLTNLVSENKFNREYYEVILYHNGGCNRSCVLNYNTKYQLLSISTDPCSGFSGYAIVKKEELSKIENSNIKIENFYQFYKSEFPKDYGILPTRACKISVLDIIFD